MPCGLPNTGRHLTISRRQHARFPGIVIANAGRMKFIGALLVIAGIVALGFGILRSGMTWTRQDRVIDSGPNQGALVKTHSLPLAPIAGGFCIVAGVVVLIASGRQHA